MDKLLFTLFFLAGLFLLYLTIVLEYQFALAGVCR